MSVIEQYGAPPVGVSATTWRMYCLGVPAAAQSADASQPAPAYPLLWFMSLIGDQMGQIEDLLDAFTYISPANGGPPANSGDRFSYSTLVDPWLADPAWLPWLAMVSGTSINGLNQLQARITIAAQQTFGRTQGSKVAMQEAVRGLFAFSSPTAAATAGAETLTLPLPSGLTLPLATGNLLNPGETSYIPTDPTWQNWIPAGSGPAQVTVAPSQIAYSGDNALLVSMSGTSSDYFGILLNREINVLPGQPYAFSFYSMAQNAASTTVYGTITWYNSSGASISTVSVPTSTGLPYGTWTQCTGVATAPAGAATMLLGITWDLASNETSASAYLTLATVTGQNPYGSLEGALLFGQGVAAGASITDLMNLPEVIMSAPSQGGISDGVAVIPNIPVAVLDHYNGNPWSIAVFVPVGIPLAAAYAAALAQKPAGYSLTLLYTYADWSNLYATFGNGTSISWNEISGLSWQIWEQTT